MSQPSNKKILYAASTVSHLERFHKPYIEKMRQIATVKTMGDGEGVDFSVPFDKHFFSFSNFKSILKIRKILKRERFDAVIVHTTLAAFLIRSAMLFMRRPYVINVVHGYLFSKQLNGMKDRVLLLCERLLRPLTDDVAVMNREDVEIARTHRLCRGKVSFIYGMGVPTKPFPQQTNRTPLSALPISDDDFVCTFVGELSHRKNQSFLIRAVRSLVDQGLPVKLLLIGEGADCEMLGEQIASLQLRENVFLLGSKNNVPDYLAATDLYFSASRSEGLPFNIMEAMECGLPILASDTKGQNDLLEADALYPLDDVTAFCEGVRRIYGAGHYGPGTVQYPILERYTLDAVFEENMKIMTSGWIDHEDER